MVMRFTRVLSVFPCTVLYIFFILLLVLIVSDENWAGLCEMKFLALEEEFIWILWEFYILKEGDLGLLFLNTFFHNTYSK